MIRIMEAAALAAVDGPSGRNFAKLAGSKKLQRQLRLIDFLDNEAFAEFLDMLEAGTPENLRHILQEPDNAA
jgi:hypothetical protein